MDERTYKTIATAAGKAKIAAAAEGGGKVNITQAAVGDGGGAYYVPTDDMTELKHEVWRGSIAAKWINEESPNIIDVKMIIPADAGGFTIREAGIFDEDGTMICVCNLPDTEKVIISTGAAGTLTLVMHLIITDADHVEFFIDPLLDIVNAEDVERMIGTAMTAHNADGKAHEVQRQVISAYDDMAGMETGMHDLGAEKARDVLLLGQNEEGEQTADLPVTALHNIIGAAETKRAPADGDYIPVIDSEDQDKMKRFPARALSSGTSFTVQVAQAKWSGEGPYTQTISDERFIADAKYTYIMGMNGSSQAGYEGGALWANDISTNGQITLVSKDEQKEDLTLNVLCISTTDEGGPGTAAKVMSTVGADSALPIPAQLIITTPPTKKDYYVNDVFDPKGMVVEVVFSGGTQVQVEAYKVEPSGPLPEGTDHVTVSYTEGDKTVSAEQTITVKRESFSIPVQSGTLTYDGESKQPGWNNYLPDKMSISGDTSKINAGTYHATFTLLDAARYQWVDGEKGEKSVEWTINKAPGSIDIQPKTLSLGITGKTGTITVTRAGDGVVSAQSDQTGTASVQVQDTKVTVTGVKTGHATISVSVAAGTNHLAAGPVTCSVDVEIPSNVLNENSWNVIKQISDANQGANYWHVGDKKGIKITGKVGNLSLSNLAIDAFILGFNHNSAKEGANKIHFALGKINDKLVGLCDSKYNTNASGDAGAFTMNTSSTNTGGWASSHMRTTILGGDKAPASAAANTLLAALPADLKAVIKPVTKYTDNKGGGNNNAGNVTATTDYLWLLAEFEIQGARSYANSTEQANQLQYDYFKASNPKIVYKHSATNDAATAWLRSPYYNTDGTFCIVNTDGSATGGNAYWSRAVLAGFAA